MAGQNASSNRRSHAAVVGVAALALVIALLATALTARAVAFAWGYLGVALVAVGLVLMVLAFVSLGQRLKRDGDPERPVRGPR